LHYYRPATKPCPPRADESVKNYQEKPTFALVRPSRVNREQNEQRPVLEPPHPLYFHPQNLAWWRHQAHHLTDSYSLEGLRIFTKDEFEFFFEHSMRAAKIVRALEALFPKVAAKMCAFLLVDIFKPRP
jgi:hypothetical protein